jgi:hypothetical protein
VHISKDKKLKEIKPYLGSKDFKQNNTMDSLPKKEESKQMIQKKSNKDIMIRPKQCSK